MLRKGVDVLVATPGRLLDLMSQRMVSFHGLEILVLDEADRMLDMGFIHDVKRIIAALPRKRQTLFFSATMPPDIQDLSRSILTDPVRIEVSPVATTAETVDQRVYMVEKNQKRALLVHVLGDAAMTRALVFTAPRAAPTGSPATFRMRASAPTSFTGTSRRTPASARWTASRTARSGCGGDGHRRPRHRRRGHQPRHQLRRAQHLGELRAPHRPHRPRRSRGIALSFCDSEERAFLRDIEHLIRMKVPVVDDHPFRSQVTGPGSAPPARASQPSRNSHGQQRPSHGPSRSAHGQQRRGNAPRQGPTAPRARLPSPRRPRRPCAPATFRSGSKTPFPRA